MAPGPEIFARVKVLPGSMRMDGEIFQPMPSSRAAF